MTLLLVDDHWLFLEGMKVLLQDLSDSIEISITDEPEIALNWIKVIDFDIVLSDLNMPGTSGVAFLQKLIAHNNKQKTLVLTMYQNENIRRTLQAMGVKGIITKTANKEEIFNAIQTILKGENYFPVEGKKVFSSFDDDFSSRFVLTPKEQKVLLELLDNKTNLEIGESFNVSPETIKFHRKNIYRKMGVNNILDLYKLMN